MVIIYVFISFDSYMELSADIWGPSFWFFLHTISLCYPKQPNSSTKKKYYDLIYNMPLFIPDKKIGNRFSDILDKYPLKPYLDSQKSFSKWMHFIHNKINRSLNKSHVDYYDFLTSYYANYKSKGENENPPNSNKVSIFIILLVLFLFVIIYVYNK